MVEESTHELHLVIPCDASAPRKVRHELDRLVAPADVKADAKLVATEIVTNAVRHSGCLPGDTLDVHASSNDDGLELSVRDAGRSASGPGVRLTTGEDGGFGLRIVERLSSRWGIERSDGCVVWAELHMDS